MGDLYTGPEREMSVGSGSYVLLSSRQIFHESVAVEQRREAKTSVMMMICMAIEYSEETST